MYFLIYGKDEQERRKRWLPLPWIGWPSPQLNPHRCFVEFPIALPLLVILKQPIPLLQFMINLYQTQSPSYQILVEKRPYTCI